jgi:hypothetical protein
LPHSRKGLQHLFRPGADGDVFREIYPTYHSGRINEKLCRTRNIRAFGSCAAMQEIVTSNRVRLRI